MTAEDEIRNRYRMIHTRLGLQSGCAVLHIGKEWTGLASGAGPDEAIIAHVGSCSTADRYFRHQPPSPGELEQAIRGVEDELMRAVRGSPAAWPLLTMDGGIRQIAHVAGLPAGHSLDLSRQAVEVTFQRLAAVSLGRPASVEGLPGEPGFAATLLILRELMHHAGFQAIRIVPAAAALDAP